jgi:uncharacterized protein YecE (DUF72 family)
MKARVRIGTQGWNYDGWTGAFYPPRTSKKETLSLYAKIFDTVEIDSTFYAIPPETSVRGWTEKTPADFTFSVKLPSEITHQNRLLSSEEILSRFCERMRLMGDKLGCVLIQLPPDFSPAEHRSLSEFIPLLPSDIKFAVEFRDREWLNSKTISELREHNVSLALTDSKWIPRKASFDLASSPTATFSYVRWLGPRDLTDFSRIQIDRTDELRGWADAFARLTEKVETVFGYFNNHYQGHSPASCNMFKKLLGLPTIDPKDLIVQPSLF